MNTDGGILYDVFLSHAWPDQARSTVLKDALQSAGLVVWYDETDVEDFEGISASVREGLSRSKCLVAYYSKNYSSRRACQWELVSAFLAAQRLGNPRDRVLVVNPEHNSEHIQPIELRDGKYSRPTDADFTRVADAVAAHAASVSGTLGARVASGNHQTFGRLLVSTIAFTGRLEAMWAVHAGLHQSDVPLITGAHGRDVVRLTGLGGNGKSVLAEEYALRFSAAYPGGVFWLDAQTATNDDASEPLMAQLQRFCQLLGLGAATRGLDELLGRLQRHLAEVDPYLWIVDEVSVGIPWEELRPWVAPTSHGKTLITSRRHAALGLGLEVQIEGLTDTEAVALSANYLILDSEPLRRDVVELSHVLGGHPLALAVSTSAIRRSFGTMTVRGFTESLKTIRSDELVVAADLSDDLPNGHEKSIAVTLSRSLDELSPPAWDSLRVARCIDGGSMPAELVVESLAKSEPSVPPPATLSGLGELESHSLMTTDRLGQRLSVHQLVRRVAELQEPDQGRFTTVAESVVRVLWSRFELATDPREFERLSALENHARLAARDLDSPVKASLMTRLSNLKYTSGDLDGARAIQSAVLESWLEHAGPTDPATLRALSNLAVTLRDQGQLDQARQLNEQVLAGRRSALGDLDEETLISVDLLATVLSRMDMTAEGVSTRAAVLNRLSPERLCTVDTMVMRHNQAIDLRSLGQFGEATQMLAELRRDRARLLGEDAPDTLAVDRETSISLALGGDTDAAENLASDLLQRSRGMVPDHHAFALGFLANLAFVQMICGDLSSARSNYLECIEHRQWQPGRGDAEYLEHELRMVSRIDELTEMGVTREDMRAIMWNFMNEEGHHGRS